MNIPHTFNAGDDVVASELNDNFNAVNKDGYYFHSKKTFSNSNTPQDFSSLPAHDDWKLVFRIKNNGATTADRILFLLGLNGITANNYTLIRYGGGAGLVNDTSTAWQIYYTGTADVEDNMFGEVVITGKVMTGAYYKSMFENMTGGYSGSHVTLRGALSGDNADVSAINLKPYNAVTGTVELWYRDAE